MRYDVSLNEEMFYFVCHFQSLDEKGREAVIDLIHLEEERCNEEKKARGYTPDDAERDLERAEDEIGFEFD